ncbi:SURF1 family protein [Noviherbaspirillum galbum]|uniref:SURF1-like protein n=1 Tax=Noviherbaspirillum galbum TaxID=2709383 RepID=A0A6B3SQN7_9BURK|nr:SURF1 family protein [Noviherbaspirillum galbum]NEX59969.1 SURF1 family protein [Noviherbaspirillum galbum]
MARGRDPQRPDDGPSPRPRWQGALAGILLLAAFAAFVTLGNWQVRRLAWKNDLIARVDSRVHALPVPVPARDRWAAITAASDEYRHVRVAGRFLHGLATRVAATSELGSGYWILTPLVADDGSVVLVNRGFVAQDAAGSVKPASGETAAEVTGLLRLSEPGGGFLRANDPGAGRWYSRDVPAIAAARGLASFGPVAPYFVDADGNGQDPASAAPGVPVGGLTVIHFHNNHLMYALTWYALALMTAACGAWLVRRRGTRRAAAGVRAARGGQGHN